MSRLKPGGVGKLALEMSTSNSGQTGYVSCVYSELNAETPKEVDEALDAADGENKQTQLREVMNTAIFEQARSSKVKDLFISGEGMGVGAAHLAIATSESYRPEITKAAASNNIAIETIYPAVSILTNVPAFIIAKEGTPAFDSGQGCPAVGNGAENSAAIAEIRSPPGAKGNSARP